MSKFDVTTIPLPIMPTEVTSEDSSGHKRSAKEMLQEALTDLKSSCNRDSASVAENKKSKSESGPKTNLLSQANSQTSQSIVDELFKDFVTQKIGSSDGQSPQSVSMKESIKSKLSVEEMNKLLDMEISSIQSRSKDVSSIVDKPKHRSHKHHKSKTSSKSRSASSSRDTTKLQDVSLLSEIESVTPSQDISAISHTAPALSPNPLTPTPDLVNAQESLMGLTIPQAASTLATEQSVESLQPSSAEQPVSASCGDTSGTPGVNLLAPLVKQQKAPMKLGLKLSAESLCLIKNNLRIDADGRVWEDGEIKSSNSEGSNKEETETDSLPSKTGSIDSSEEDRKSQSSKKKKHKRKHKKKDKKSSKDRDKHKTAKTRDRHKRSKYKHSRKESEKGERSSESKEREKEKDRTCDIREREGRDKKLKSGEKKENEMEVEGLAADAEKARDKDGDRNKGGKKRRGSRSRSRSPKHRRKLKKRSGSRSKSPRKAEGSRGRYSEWDARYYSGGSPKSSRSRSRSASRGRAADSQRLRQQDSSKEKEKDLRMHIDKAKLRKIAIANALQNMKKGQGPQLNVVTVKSGGKSVEELTDFCKKISEKDHECIENDLSDTSEEEVAKESDEEDALIHHPFKLRDPGNIVMNIRNAKQLPVLTPSEKQAQQASLRLTFPVSSGSHHRANESEWVPVEKTTAPPTAPKATVTTSVAVTAPPRKPVKETKPTTSSIFPDPVDTKNIDIGALISERLHAVRQLQENPNNVQALSKMHQVQEQTSKWATSRHLPGQFMGSTGAQVLSQEQLVGDKKHQAWARKTQFQQAAPVSGGIGMFLLQKMGWKHGEGLGKNSEGSKEPLMLDVKVDRKGLQAATEGPKKKAQAANTPRAKDLSSKHPVSALMELCTKRHWGPPIFTIVNESGPDHNKHFLFKVTVNNVLYQPPAVSSNKKLAKAQCAAACLKEMGLIPRDAPLNI